MDGKWSHYQNSSKGSVQDVSVGKFVFFAVSSKYMIKCDIVDEIWMSEDE